MDGSTLDRGSLVSVEKGKARKGGKTPASRVSLHGEWSMHAALPSTVALTTPPTGSISSTMHPIPREGGTVAIT